MECLLLKTSVNPLAPQKGMHTAGYLKVALTSRGDESIKVHAGTVPRHAPDHPTNRRPAAGEAVRVTTVFLGRVADTFSHPKGQSAPVGLDVMLP